jgi:hypothetical protein
MRKKRFALYPPTPIQVADAWTEIVGVTSGIVHSPPTLVKVSGSPVWTYPAHIAFRKAVGVVVAVGGVAIDFEFGGFAEEHAANVKPRVRPTATVARFDRCGILHLRFGAASTVPPSERGISHRLPAAIHPTA